MAKDSKFGTFGGVYTPSVLTILGVIMYLRLPWVVGSAGLWTGLAIIVVAHVISISTGLSISSIATDKNVGAGGPYYIVSRSLGLPIGGTLGLALFIGLAFSISLYLIGFSESFLRYWELEPTPNNIRICGSISLLVLTTITLISTAFALKTQYWIFGIIVLSLLSIFLGSSKEMPDAAGLLPAEGGPGIEALFAIFFPAVTGFTAGVNMSGDLKNPKQSIPRGTMVAIATGLLVYGGLAVFLAYRVPQAELIGNPAILQEIAYVPVVVVLGIWGATLSSALGSILGAPRILQAVSGDGITPRVFSKTHGKTGEPRNALILAFLIGWGGIMVAELDAIARVVSMVFLTTYGFLNLSCALESWTSPDFRPQFRIPTWISVLGGVTCLLVMIQLDLAAMAGSTALMAGLYAWLKRRQLQLESGDTWAGFWASLVRAGLHRLSEQRRPDRNWRPNVILFRGADSPQGLLRFAHSLVRGSGLLSDFRFGGAQARATDNDTGEPPPVGVFTQELAEEKADEAILNHCRFHGFASLSPNTVLLDWNYYKTHPQRLGQVAERLTELDYNQLFYGASTTDGNSKAHRIDIWWSDTGGSLSLSIALIRFLSSAEEYDGAKLRFLLISSDPSNNDILRTRARRLLTEARVDATVTVLSNALQHRPMAEWIAEESADAALAVVGLNQESGARLSQELTRLGPLQQQLHSILAAVPSSQFEEQLSVARPNSDSLRPSAIGREEGDLTTACYSELPDVQERVRSLAAAYQAATLKLHEHGIGQLYKRRIKLLEALRSVFTQQFEQLDKGLGSDNLRRQRKLINRVQSTAQLEARQLLENFETTELTEQQAMLDGRITAFLEEKELAPEQPDSRMEVFSPKEHFKPNKEDTGRLRRLKQRRRFIAFWRRKDPSHLAPIGVLQRYYRQQLGRTVLQRAVQRFSSDSHQLAIHLGKQLQGLVADPEQLKGQGASSDAAQYVQAQKALLQEHFDGLVTHERARARELQQESLSEAKQCLEQLAADLQSLDIWGRAKKDRKLLGSEADVTASLDGFAEHWHRNQLLLHRRARLALQLSSFQHRLRAVVVREREQLELELRSGLLKKVETFCSELADLESQLKSDLPTSSELLARSKRIHFEHKTTLEASPLVERLERDIHNCTADLPESVLTLTNDSVEKLEERQSEAGEEFELVVRALVLYVAESELTGRLPEQIAEIPALERRASAVGGDVARLLSFQLSEFASGEQTTQEELAMHLLPAIRSGRERLETEKRRLGDIAETVLTALDDRLAAVLRRSTADELASAADTLDQSLRLERGRRAVTGVRGLAHRLSAGLRHASIRGLYRASAGLLMARNLQGSRPLGGNTVQRLRSWVVSHSPRQEVLDKLPFFYRQLFFGQSTLSETFWVARPNETAACKGAISSFRQGARGCLLIHGERGSGKSALWQHLAARHLEKFSVYRLPARPGGSTNLVEFETSLQEALGRQGHVTELMQGLTRPSAIILDDFEQWWERAPEGFRVVDLVLDLIDRFGDRCLFILCMNKQALQLLSELRPMQERALAVVECGSLGVEALKDVVQLRHGSTGLAYELAGKAEADLSQWAAARLFASHTQYSRGYVGVALQAWITHIEKADKEGLRLRAPSLPGATALDELKPKYTALLVQLCLHRQITEGRLARLSSDSPRQLREQLAVLMRMGLVIEPRPQIFEINRFVHHLMVERFQQRAILP